MVRGHLIKKLNALVDKPRELWVRHNSCTIWNISFCLRVGRLYIAISFWSTGCSTNGVRCGSKLNHSVVLVVCDILECKKAFYITRNAFPLSPKCPPRTFILFYWFILILSNVEKFFSPFNRILERKMFYVGGIGAIMPCIRPFSFLIEYV